MRTLPSSAKPEKTSTFSSKWVGSATGITKDKARPAREGEWFDGKITDTKCRGCLCRPVFHPVFEGACVRPADAKACGDDRGQRQRDSQSP